MQVSEIPTLAWAVFGGAFVAGMTLFGSLFLITRRLGVEWQKHFAGYHLDPAFSSRIGKLLFGRETAPNGANIGSLLWIVRGCWLVMTIPGPHPSAGP